MQRCPWPERKSPGTHPPFLLHLPHDPHPSLLLIPDLRTLEPRDLGIQRPSEPQKPHDLTYVLIFRISVMLNAQVDKLVRARPSAPVCRPCSHAQCQCLCMVGRSPARPHHRHHRCMRVVTTGFFIRTSPTYSSWMTMANCGLRMTMTQTRSHSGRCQTDMLWSNGSEAVRMEARQIHFH